MNRSSLSLLFLVPLLAGCALAGLQGHSKHADELYVLKAETPAASCMHPASIKIAVPRVGPGLDTARIAVADGAQHLTYFDGAAWAATLPETLHHFLVDSFGKSGAFTNISTDLDTAKADWLLLTEVEEFQLTGSGKGDVKLRLTGKLMNAQSRHIATTIPIEKIHSGPYHMADIISSFNAAANEAAAELVTRTAAVTPPCNSSVPKEDKSKPKSHSDTDTSQ